MKPRPLSPRRQKSRRRTPRQSRTRRLRPRLRSRRPSRRSWKRPGAVAEAIVAAQDAGLVKTGINPPPIFDILITGRANDESTLKARTGVSPEVLGAWFTGYGTVKDITP